MDTTDNEAIKKLAGLFYEKGYRQDFTLHYPGADRVILRDSLSGCLAAMLKLHPEKATLMDLQTHAPYRSDILCRFRLLSHQKEGFSVRELLLSCKTGQRTFRFRHNREIPGAMTLEGFFPKERHWKKPGRGKGFG